MPSYNNQAMYELAEAYPDDDDDDDEPDLPDDEPEDYW